MLRSFEVSQQASPTGGGWQGGGARLSTVPPRDPATPVSFPAGAFGAPDRMAAPRDPLAGLDLPETGRLDVVCVRPIHNVLEYAALYRLAAALRERAPDLVVHLHLRSALCDDAPFLALPVRSVTRWGDRGGRGTLAAGLRRLAREWTPGAAALVLAPPRGWRRVAAGALHTAPLDFRTPGDDAAADRFLAALDRETPLWRVAASAPPPLSRQVAGHRFLIHQARFHVGDTLWLTPLLRALHALFPRPQVTLVAPPIAATVLAGNPHLDELIAYQPREGDEGRQRVLAALFGRSYDAALLALARRSESRWLARSDGFRGGAAAGQSRVPRRFSRFGSRLGAAVGGGDPRRVVLLGDAAQPAAAPPGPRSPAPSRRRPPDGRRPRGPRLDGGPPAGGCFTGRARPRRPRLRRPRSRRPLLHPLAG